MNRRPDRRWMEARRCDEEFLDLPTGDQVAVCDDCPVITQCLAYAAATGATYVVYGGRKLGRFPIRELG